MSITRSSSRSSGSRVGRSLAAALTAVGLGAGLAGCTIIAPEMGSYLETVPEALEQSDLGVTRVSAGSSLSGFVRTVSFGVHLDRDSVTSSEIEQTLGLMAGKIDQPSASTVELSFWDDGLEPIDTESACEAIGSPSLRCDYLEISIDLDDLDREFGE